MKEEILPHPYTYMPARAYRDLLGLLRWFDLETGEELPPYFGYGQSANEKVKQWYQIQKETLT
jgi:hypothetical protein